MRNRIRKVSAFLLSIFFVCLSVMGEVSSMDSMWTGGTGVYNVAGNSTINNNGGNSQFRENSSASTATIVSNALIRCYS